MKTNRGVTTRSGPGARRRIVSTRSLVALAVVASTGALAASQGVSTPSTSQAPTLDETRLTMDKWIETQQIISKETKEWRQGKEILTDRLDAIRQEAAALEEKIKQAQANIADVEKKRSELVAARDQVQGVRAHVAEVVTGLEGDVKRLYRVAPETLQTRMAQLHQRIPEDAATTKVQLAERIQNVLGILGALNTASNEINVFYEVRALEGGRPSEVQVIYVGLAQAYYLSAGGEAGIGRPSVDGWQWEPSRAIAGDVHHVLEILQNKQSPAFVALPVRIQ